MKQKPTNILGGAGFYVILAVCLVSVGAASWFWLFRDRPATAPDSSAETAAPASSAEVNGPAEIPADNQDAVVPEHPKIPGVPAQSVSQTAPAKPAAAAPDLVVSPLNGAVLSAFSMDRLAYDKTLNDWRTHNGMDIAAGAGTKVQAASAGTVKSVEDDPMMGTTVTLEHAGGYQTVYANLESQPTVKAGDSVSAGQILGAVGSTSIVENSEGPHLHFSVLKNGQPVNPETFLKK